MTRFSQNGWPHSTRPYRKEPPEGSVGLVMPMRDSLKFFKLAFHSVISFTDIPYMFTVVDNMSRFTTKTYLQSIEKNHSVNILPYQKNYNYAAEINIGIRYMFYFESVKYGCVLNSDIVVEPYWIKNMIRVLDSSPDIGIVGPLTNFGESCQEGCKSRDVVSVDRLSGFCLAFKRKLFEDLNGFDETYEGGRYEDQDFCYRAKKKGWRSVVDCSTYVHHFGRATVRHDPKSDHYAEKNRAIFFQRYPELVSSNA